MPRLPGGDAVTSSMPTRTVPSDETSCPATIRKVVVEYPQGWLAGEASGKQAEWRVDPAHAGEGGCIADIGVHAFQLAEFVTGLRVTRLLAGRLRETNEALADSVFLDVTGRTAKRLLELADGRDSFLLPVTQEELAGMVGASRERVNKAIASFIRLGWIDQHDRRYTIKLRDRLELRSR